MAIANNIGSKGAKAIAECLPSSRIQTLSLRCTCYIDIELGKLVLTCKDCRIGPEGAKSIAENLPSSKVRTLRLGSTIVGS